MVPTAAVVPNTAAVTPAAGLDPVGLIQQVLAILPLAVTHLQTGNLLGFAADPIMAVDTVLYGVAQQAGPFLGSALPAVLGPVADTPPAKALVSAVQTYFKYAANPPTFAWSGGFGINPFSLAAVTFNDFTAPVFALFPAAQAFVNGLNGVGATSAAATVPKVQTNLLKLPNPTSATSPSTTTKPGTTPKNNDVQGDTTGMPKTKTKEPQHVTTSKDSSGKTDAKGPADKGQSKNQGLDTQQGTQSKTDNPSAKDNKRPKDSSSKDGAGDHRNGHTGEGHQGKGGHSS